MATAPAIRLGAVRPEEAVAAFTERGLLQPTFNWQDVWQQEHSRAFAVAGVMRLDILQAFRDGVDEAVKTGLNPQDFRARMQAMLEARGFWGNVKIKDPATGRERTTRFDQARLQLIYDVNLRQSYAAGRWAAIQRNKARQPFIVYRTMGDERVRASHKPWDGVALPVDHPWWRTHFPPNGWRCRCTAIAVSEKDLQRRRDAGLPVKTDPPPVQWLDYVNPHTGEITPVPRGVDPGFAYNPGVAREAAMLGSTLAKVARAQPAAGAAVLRDAIDAHPALVREGAAPYAEWVRTVVATGRSAGAVRAVGALLPQVVAAFHSRGSPPASALLVVRGRDIVHALREAKPDDVKLETEAFERLHELLAGARAVLRQLDRPDTVLYVTELQRRDGRVAKIAVRIDYEVKVRDGGPRDLVRANLVRTVSVLDPQALRDPRSYELIWGSLP